MGPDIDVQIPTDPRQRFVIDAMAFYVMRDGCEFEQVGRGQQGLVGWALQAGQALAPDGGHGAT